MVKVQVKSSAIPRAGYEYQDLVGIEVLLRQYRDPELYAWVLLEADDTDYRALDDVVAARKDGSYEFVQVKFTVDSDRYELDWDWLLAKTKTGTSMLEKWANPSPASPRWVQSTVRALRPTAYHLQISPNA